MNMSLLTIILAIVLVALIVVLLVRRVQASDGRQQEQPPLEVRTAPPPARPSQPGVITGATAAVKDMAGSMVGLEALHGEPDDLTQLKGLGPKAAAQLKLLGITRFAQLAALDSAQLSALDEKMGVFRGRIERDRWIEQARYLARGDTASFEAEFGRLG